MQPQEPAPPAKPRSRTAQNIFLFTGFTLAVPITAILIWSSASTDAYLVIWFTAGAWTFVVGFLLAFYNGIRYKDWSAFNHHNAASEAYAQHAKILNQAMQDRHRESSRDLADFTERYGDYSGLRD